MEKAKFWEDGIRFECQGTGRCCTSRGENGYVYFTEEDRSRMARVLGMDLREFTRTYLGETDDGIYYLRNPEDDCVFLKGTRCSVYEGRPTQCRTWPFWPENMNAKTWNEEVATFCAGVGKGRVVRAEEIDRILKADPFYGED